MASQDADLRLTFQESMALAQLQDKGPANNTQKRYMGTRPAWLPGSDLPDLILATGKSHGAAYGGHVYVQSSLAICRALTEDEEQRGVSADEKLGLHVS